MCLGGGGGVTGNANVAHRPAQDLGPSPATLIVSAPSHYWGPAAAILHLQGVMGAKWDLQFQSKLHTPVNQNMNAQSAHVLIVKTYNVKTHVHCPAQEMRTQVK